MKFRLTYEGQLLGSSNNNPRAAHKHSIRMIFHRQLRRLWECHNELSELVRLPFPDYETAVSGKHGGPFSGKTSSYAELVANHHTQHGRGWLPLVLSDMATTCSVEILFLRAGTRGHVLNVGDIDGRLKTIFDALAIPRSNAGVDAEASDGPTYVLLQDDSLISHVSVEADELLQPTGQNEIQNDARVVITVNVRMTRPNWMSLRFAGD